jgi:hypothetical protein
MGFVFHDHDGVIKFQLLPLTILFLGVLALNLWKSYDGSKPLLQRN